MIQLRDKLSANKKSVSCPMELERFSLALSRREDIFSECLSVCLFSREMKVIEIYS